jgi:hypothetical protein
MSQLVAVDVVSLQHRLDAGAPIANVALWLPAV